MEEPRGQRPERASRALERHQIPRHNIINADQIAPAPVACADCGCSGLHARLRRGSRRTVGACGWTRPDDQRSRVALIKAATTRPAAAAQSGRIPHRRQYHHVPLEDSRPTPGPGGRPLAPGRIHRPGGPAQLHLSTGTGGWRGPSAEPRRVRPYPAQLRRVQAIDFARGEWRRPR